MRIVPVIGNGKFTSRPIHIQDVAAAIEAVLTGPFTRKYEVYDLGGPDIISFNDLIRTIAKEVCNKKVFLFHIPTSVSYVLASIFKLLLSKPPITISNVVATNQEAAVNIAPFSRSYGFRPRSLERGLKDLKENEKKYGTESYILLSYLLHGKRVEGYQAQLFKQAVTFYGLNEHQISQSILCSHSRIGAFDAVTKVFYSRGKFQRKMLIAAAIVECSPISSDILLPKKTGAVTFVVRMSRVAFISVWKFILGALLLFIPGLYRDNA